VRILKIKFHFGENMSKACSSKKGKGKGRSQKKHTTNLGVEVANEREWIEEHGEIGVLLHPHHLLEKEFCQVNIESETKGTLESPWWE
jgi:hypothetical protein